MDKWTWAHFKFDEGNELVSDWEEGAADNETSREVKRLWAEVRDLKP
jgi:hypothetical protein